MEPIEEKKEMSKEELMAQITKCKDTGKKAKLLSQMRAMLATEEKAIRAEAKKNKEAAKEERAELKTTHSAVIDARKAFLSAYRDMNVIINGKSPLKHFTDFSSKVTLFNLANITLTNALDAHIEQLKSVKEKMNGGN